MLYHCGPVILKENGNWRITAAGPTASIREEPYEAEIISRHGVRAVMGEGGMGPKTLQALKAHGAVYLNAIGGAAQFYARCIERVKELPAIVTMDASGRSPPLALPPATVAEEVFRRRVIQMLRQQGRLEDEAAAGLLAWRHSGFSVHHAIRVEPGDADGVERLCRLCGAPHNAAT